MEHSHTHRRPVGSNTEDSRTTATESTQSQNDTTQHGYTPRIENQSTEQVTTKIVTGIEVQHARHTTDDDGSEGIALPTGEFAERVIAGGTATHIQIVDEHNGKDTEFVRVYVTTPTTTFSVFAQDNEQVADLKNLTDKNIPADGDRYPINPVEVKVTGELFPQYQNGTHRGTLIDADHIKPVNKNLSVRHLLKSTVVALDRITDDGDDVLMSDAVDEYKNQLIAGLEDIRNMV